MKFNTHMTYQRAPFFPHRRNPDGSLTSICLTCCSTVASHKTEEELVELDKKHICETAILSQRGAPEAISRGEVTKMRTPKVGDRVAIPKHAIIFLVKSVNETKQTVDAEAALENEPIEEGVPWKIITFIDP